MSSKSIKIFLGILLGIFTVVAINYFTAGTQQSPIDLEAVTKMNAVDEKEYWMQQISDKGGLAAYKYFSSLYSKAPSEIQHTHAHVFGEALYKVEGIDGIAVCDSNFSFGCFHSFFGWAMITKGTGIVKELDAACVSVYGIKGLGCPHGIGHGVMVEIGNDNLDTALNLCSELSWQEPIGGCTSGVFMEYNQNTMGDGNPRQKNADWHYPCNVIDSRFTPACYFEQTTWWSGLTEGDFNLIGKLCSEVESTAGQEACFRGAGHTSASRFDFDFDKMKNTCSLMPDQDSELLCIEGATWLTSWEPRFQNTWQQMCDGFTGESHQQCLDSKNFI